MPVEPLPILIAFGVLISIPLAPRVWGWLRRMPAQISPEDAEELKTY